MYDFDGHSVIGLHIDVTGEHIVLAELNAHAIQKLADRLSIGIHDAPVSLINDRDCLHSLNVNAVASVMIGCGVGILFAQLDACFIQDHIRIRTESFINRYVPTIGDYIAVLSKNSLRQQAGHRRYHYRNCNQAIRPTIAFLYLFFRSAHKSILLSIMFGFKYETIVTLL